VNWEEVAQTDAEIYRLLVAETERQRATLELIASENFASPAVLAAMGTTLTNKYAEGLPGARYYGGCRYVDEVEELCRTRCRELFGAEWANVQPHSGSQANMAAYMAFLQPGDTVMGLSLAQGGHLTHGSPVNFSGQLYRFVAYGLDPETERIDYDALAATAERERPKLIVAGASAYPRVLDFPRLRAIADAVGAYLMVDMAHIAGLIAAGEHPSPVGLADVVTSTTHKTLRGPRGGFIVGPATTGAKVDKVVFPGIQGGPLMHVIAAKAVAFGEAQKPSFKAYAHQVVQNAKRLAEELMARGYRIVSGGTDTHLMLMSFVGTDMTGREAEERLERVGITVNKNAVPGDPRPPRVTSGIRIGTPAVTTRGMKEQEMATIADLIDRALKVGDDPSEVRRIEAGVAELTHAFPLYPALPVEA
jgi:glycine hydroxymethyltransferase